MDVCVHPCRVNSSIDIPPSKSISHRAIICAALGNGRSCIDNICYSKDVVATINAVRAIGANIVQMESSLVIDGIGGDFVGEDFVVDCFESGSTLRFLIPIFSLTNTNVQFCGSRRLFERPQSVYEKIFAEQGIVFIKEDDNIKVKGSLKSGVYELEGNISSQFITGLLLTLPLLDGNSIIKIKPPIESRSYIDLTLQVMLDFGVDACFIDENTIEVRGNQSYCGCEFSVEGDYSQLAFFAVLSAIKGRLECGKLRIESKQGDRKVVEILRAFNGKVQTVEGGYIFSEGALESVDIDLSDCPDLGPILMVLSAFSKGSSTIFNAGRLRIKESDRIEAMETELRKLLVDISSGKDSITINGRKPMERAVTVYAHNDHRIAMSLSVFAVCAEFPVIIEGAECVEKSYPSFFEDLRRIGVLIE